LLLRSTEIRPHRPNDLLRPSGGKVQGRGKRGGGQTLGEILPQTFGTAAGLKRTLGTARPSHTVRGRSPRPAGRVPNQYKYDLEPSLVT